MAALLAFRRSGRLSVTTETWSDRCSTRTGSAAASGWLTGHAPHTLSFRLTSTAIALPVTWRARVRSDPEQIRQAFSVRRRAAEQQLGGLGAPEVQVSGVFPGEPDAAVDLDVFLRGVQVRVRAVSLGHAGRLRQVLRRCRRRPCRVVRSGARRLDLEQHRRALVLDRLEGPDRLAELLAGLRVRDRHVQAGLASATR